MPLFEVRDLVRLLSSQSPLSLQQRVSHLGAKHQVLSNASWNELKLFGAIKVLVEVVTTDEWDILSPTEQRKLVTAVICVLPSIIRNMNEIAEDPAHVQLLKAEVPAFLKRALSSLKFILIPKLLYDTHTQLTKFLRGLMAFEEDTNFIQSIAFEETFNLIFEILFRRPQVPGQADEDEVYQLLAALRVGAAFYVAKHAMSDAISRAITKFHPRKILKRFRLFFTNNAYYDYNIYRFTNHLVFNFVASEEMSRIFLDDGVQLVLAVRAWSVIRRREVIGVTSILLASIAQMLLQLTDGTVEDSHPNTTSLLEAVAILLRRQDLMLLLGKSMLEIPDENTARGVEEELGLSWPLVRLTEAACIRDPGLREGIELSWLDSHDKLLIAASSIPPRLSDGLKRPNYDAGFILWKQVGEMLEFDADRIRQRKSILQRAGVDASMGCAWLRCPLHGNEMAEPRRDMMFCVGCRKVQYCDARCQRLDWVEGNHRVYCRANGASQSGLDDGLTA